MRFNISESARQLISLEQQLGKAISLGLNPAGDQISSASLHVFTSHPGVQYPAFESRDGMGCAQQMVPPNRVLLGAESMHICCLIIISRVDAIIRYDMRVV